MGKKAGRSIHRLTAKSVKALGEGMHADGNNLYLQVGATGAKSWVFRYTLNKRTRDMGLGSETVLSLAQARRKAEEARQLLAQGKDPLAERASTAAAKGAIPTFWQSAEAYIASHKAGWKSEKHAEQWTSTLATYAKPVIGHKPVNTITVDDMLEVLSPIWNAKTETASRVRGRMEAVIDYASVGKPWATPNPATWRGKLSHKLPKPRSVTKVAHFDALPYAQLPAFMAKLAKQPGFGAKALAFTILTAARTGMVLGARWEEVNLETAIWTVPASRMKAKAEHVVPLSEPALAILRELEPLQAESGYIFPGGKVGKHLSNMSMASVLARMAVPVTVHGFRSTFKDWCAETTDYANEVSEAALAHTIGSKVEAAYRRGNLLSKRADLMKDWASFAYATS